VSYLQAFIIAVIQGVTELFPISSLGHSVLVPAWIGGSWQTMVTQSSQPSSETSFYLAYIVALHCATALALLWYFRADWTRIIRGLLASLLRSLRARQLAIHGPDERLAWMIVLATIPVGLTGSHGLAGPVHVTHWPPRPARGLAGGKRPRSPRARRRPVRR